MGAANKQTVLSKLKVEQNPLNSPLKSKEIDNNKLEASKKAAQQNENAKNAAVNAKASVELANQQKKTNSDKDATAKEHDKKAAANKEDQNKKSANNTKYGAAIFAAIMLLLKLKLKSFIKSKPTKLKTKKTKKSKEHNEIEKIIQDINKLKVGPTILFSDMGLTKLLLEELERRLRIGHFLHELTPQKIDQLVANMAPIAFGGKIYTKDSLEVEDVANKLEQSITPERLAELNSIMNNVPLDQNADSVLAQFVLGEVNPKPEQMAILQGLLKQAGLDLSLSQDQKQAAGFKSTAEQQAQSRIQPEETSSFTMKP